MRNGHDEYDLDGIEREQYGPITRILVWAIFYASGLAMMAVLGGFAWWIADKH